ncbi:phosphoadenylyl-sulfate reductase [Ornithobacterium rhinotracheale]|uniref:phosphoadenylyl-sulfate reductase n=1 Tax=Ornithobacterium rhinotracheale TaxID=28251 RepID=UPI00129C23DC|nr:phosphoadenylyl-sulfate reductase [Ornithobacterium rhinotracheale]MRJ09834.1 phosphoadenylyl-sulfate reductase [Ornithobacterium rhinotracheale]
MSDLNLDIAVNQISEQLQKMHAEGRKIMITSSFQTHSLPLLHISTRAIKDLPVIFIDTGFHFAETYAFRDQIVREWSLNLKNVRSKTSKHQQVNEDGQFLYASDTDYCCHINKVEPLNTSIQDYDIWIAGLRRDQTKFRSGLDYFEKQKSGITKYHPILDWNSKMIYEYRKLHNLPAHPLEEKGFFSIGCFPCTQSVHDENERGGRWAGSNKTECGIHLNK